MSVPVRIPMKQVEAYLDDYLGTDRWVHCAVDEIPVELDEEHNLVIHFDVFWDHDEGDPIEIAPAGEPHLVTRASSP